MASKKAKPNTALDIAKSFIEWCKGMEFAKGDYMSDTQMAEKIREEAERVSAEVAKKENK